MRARITGTGSYLPQRVLTNDEIARLVETSDAWITERTGIKERRIAADGEFTSDLGAEAGRRALAAAGLTAEQLDLIIVATITPDMPMPATAAYVQAKLGAKNAFAFDISAACAGSIYALTVADKFIRTGAAKRVLVIGAELTSRGIDWTDRDTCILFGDGAGAMVVEGGDDDGPGLVSSHLFTDGTQTDILWIPAGGSRLPVDEAVLRDRMHKLKMNGREVFRTAVRSLVMAAGEALKAQGIGPDKVDHVIAHQANRRIIEAALDRVGIPLERCWLNLHKYGNTSSASVPISLDEAARAGRLKSGDLVMMLAVGSGIAWGSALYRW